MIFLLFNNCIKMYLIVCQIYFTLIIIYINACGNGFEEINCDSKCPYPMYGQGCQSVCSCNVRKCNHVNGCNQSSAGKNSLPLNIFYIIYLWTCFDMYFISLYNILYVYTIFSQYFLFNNSHRKATYHRVIFMEFNWFNVLFYFLYPLD